MKVILRADIENLGNLGDVVTVKNGFGRNYLLPQRLATIATPGNLKAFELERRKLQAKMDALRTDAQSLCEKLEGLVLVIPMRVGDNDKLYGSVTSHIVGDALAAKGLDVDRRRILFDQAIRTLGDHHVRIRLYTDVIANITVKVVSEDHPEVPSEAVEESKTETPVQEVPTEVN